MQTTKPQSRTFKDLMLMQNRQEIRGRNKLEYFPTVSVSQPCTLTPLPYVPIQYTHFPTTHLSIPYTMKEHTA